MKYNVTKAVRKYTKGRKIKTTDKSIKTIVAEVASDRVDRVAELVIRASTPTNNFIEGFIEGFWKTFSLYGKFFVHNNARQVLLKNTTYMMFTGASPIVQATLYTMQRYGLELVASVLAYNANKKIDEYVKEALIGKTREFVLAADDWAHTWMLNRERTSFEYGTEY